MATAMVQRLLDINPVREQGWRSARGLQRVGENFRVGFCFEFDPEVFELPPQLGVVIDLTVERDGETSVEGDLRLNRMLGVDDAQSSRTHRCVRPRREQRVGYVAAMQDALDQPLDGDFRVRPVDRNSKAAHAPYPGCDRRWHLIATVPRLNVEVPGADGLQILFTLVVQG